MRKPELLAPGGGFAAAYQAFEAGADGVYLGLSEFSARRAATNFTLEQLRRILGLARLRGRKVYVTLNTVVREEEMPRVATLCAWLESLGVTGSSCRTSASPRSFAAVSRGSPFTPPRRWPSTMTAGCGLRGKRGSAASSFPAS